MTSGTSTGALEAPRMQNTDKQEDAQARIKSLRDAAEVERDEAGYHEDEAYKHENEADRLDAEAEGLEQAEAAKLREANKDRFAPWVGEHSVLFVDRNVLAVGEGQNWLSNGHVAVRISGEAPATDDTLDAGASVTSFNENWHPPAGERREEGENVRLGDYLFKRDYLALAVEYSSTLHVKPNGDHGILYGHGEDGEAVAVVMGLRGSIGRRRRAFTGA